MTANNQSYGPQYYKRGSIEVWDFIRDQSLNYHLGNAVKYICRAGYKDDPISDLSKAIHYLTNELEHVTNDYTRHTQDILKQSSKGVQGHVRPTEWPGSREDFVSEKSDC